MDRIDRSILHLLQLDGRLSNARLASQVNLSESACLRRVKALEQRGYLRDYVGLVDQAMAGYPDNVFVRITLLSQQQADLAAFEAEVWIYRIGLLTTESCSAETMRAGSIAGRHRARDLYSETPRASSVRTRAGGACGRRHASARCTNSLALLDQVHLARRASLHLRALVLW